MNDLTLKINHKNSFTTMWQTQGRNFTTNDMAPVDFYLLVLSATKTVAWKCHLADSIESRYDIILGRDLLNALVLDLKFPKYFTGSGKGSYKDCSAPMVELTDFDFKALMERLSNQKNTL